MIISNSRKFIFIHLHKTAGESMTSSLAPTLQWNDLACGWAETDVGKAMTTVGRHYHLHKHSPVPKVKEVVGSELWDAYFTFSIVRNPYHRILSLYTYLERHANRFSNRVRLLFRPFLRKTPSVLEWTGMKIYLETKDFSRFIRHPDFLPKAPGAKPMLTCLSDPNGLAVDFVAKVETLDADFQVICQKIGRPELSLIRRNTSPKKGSFHFYYQTQADLDFIYDYYRQDFDAFGYERLLLS